MTASLVQKAVIESLSSKVRVAPVATGSAEDATTVAAFETAMTRTRELVDKVSAPSAIAPVDHNNRNLILAQAEMPVGTSDPMATQAGNDRKQTIRALELSNDSLVKPASEGDTILSGLKKLQGVFSDRQRQLNETIEVPNLSAQTLMRIQMDMVQYTLMIDVASKVSGKLTQSVDSLVKGQ